MLVCSHHAASHYCSQCLKGFSVLYGVTRTKWDESLLRHPEIRCFHQSLNLFFSWYRNVYVSSKSYWSFYRIYVSFCAVTKLAPQYTQPYFIFDIAGIIITRVFVISNVTPDGIALPGVRSNYIHYKVWGGITYPFPNVREWISNSIHIIFSGTSGNTPGNFVPEPCQNGGTCCATSARCGSSKCAFSANEGRCCFVKSSLIGWGHTHNARCFVKMVAGERFQCVIGCMVIETTSWWQLCRNHLCMRPANERRHHSVPSSLIGWAHSQNDPCFIFTGWTIDSNARTNSETCY